jgi:chemosensory pili system protein ChpA (sensor histidine kinase/response regulator)
MLSRPQAGHETSVHTIERASFALLDYLGGCWPASRCRRWPVPAVRRGAGLAGADRVHPADLWEADFAWHDLPLEPACAPRAADEAARGTMEAIVLRLMRRADAGLDARCRTCAPNSAPAPPAVGTLVAAGGRLCEAEAAGLLPQG